ncbi:MAG: hypothetical protein IJT94_03270, partial [Oscillibacter sp.]|nr:hypothetical protein [Oscillibacter sp.]
IPIRLWHFPAAAAFGWFPSAPGSSGVFPSPFGPLRAAQRILFSSYIIKPERMGINWHFITFLLHTAGTNWKLFHFCNKLNLLL